MRDQEEIEESIDDFGLLNETFINVGSLRWVSNGGSCLEESLSDTLVHNDKSVFW